MQTAKNDAASMPENRVDPRKLLKRIGSTTYEVSIRFSEKSTETIQDIVASIMIRRQKHIIYSQEAMILQQAASCQQIPIGIKKI